MFMLLRMFIFGIISILVFTFTSYLNFIYVLDTYRNWFFNNVQNFEEYDYIIVGAGSAGALLSAQLADDKHKVLLIEAGGAVPPFLDIPLLSPLLQKTPYDWQYLTVPQSDACKSLINNQSSWAMGKILGGSSRLNYMLYVRGHPSDYEKLFPEFIEPLEKNSDPVSVRNLKWNTDFADIVLRGIEELGQCIGNINEDLKIGFMKAQLSMENGRRWSTDKVLYTNSKRRLTVITHALVTKVLIKSNKAVGIQFLTLSKSYVAMARKGVIVSAGAVGSPKLLMLSGIGPKEHLNDLKINVIKDLPVGQHLVDHILTGFDLITLNVSVSLSMTNALNPKSALDYFLFGEGPWTSAGVEVLGTFYSSLQKDKAGAPDLQLLIFPLGISKDNGNVLKKSLGICDKVYNEYFAPLAHKNAVTIAPVLLHPKSSGEIRLNSNDPLDAPLIDPKYLSNKEDVLTLIDGLKFVKKLVETNAMKVAGASIYKKRIPGCDNEVFGTIQYWECYVRHLTITTYHPAGTCRMGDVVDKSFRVHGIANLYVVDASVLPILPSGNINAAVMMLAEKAARMFKEDMKVYTNNRKCYKSTEHCSIFRFCNNAQKK